MLVAVVLTPDLLASRIGHAPFLAFWRHSVAVLHQRATVWEPTVSPSSRTFQSCRSMGVGSKIQSVHGIRDIIVQQMLG